MEGIEEQIVSDDAGDDLGDEARKARRLDKRRPRAEERGEDAELLADVDGADVGHCRNDSLVEVSAETV